MKLKTAQAFIIMGVSGSGKSSVADLLAKELACEYFDADNFHPEANVNKMSQGMPLNDTDRQPWLERLHKLIHDTLNKDKSLTLACSALKQSYRNTLKGNLKNVIFVHLDGSFDLINARMQARAGHFMKAEMLKSQFEALEAPKNAITVSIAQPVEKIVARIIETLTAEQQFS